LKFWDTSALITLLIDEPHSDEIRSLAKEDEAIAAWWSSPVECLSAFARLRREDHLTVKEEEGLRRLLALVVEEWTEIEPTAEVRGLAGRILFTHPLRAADSLQLAAALMWAGRDGAGHEFVCLDNRLRLAARKESFTVLPDEP
jgi:predicted nucleic acid-binding protein